MRIFYMIAFTASAILFTMSGCVKWYCCSNPTAQYICIRPTDTIYLTVSAPSSALYAAENDSLSLYTSKGYSCIYTGSGVQYGITSCTRGTGEKNKAEKAGEVCQNGADDGCGYDGECGE